MGVKGMGSNCDERVILMGNCDWENCHWVRKGDCALGVEDP